MTKQSAESDALPSYVRAIKMPGELCEPLTLTPEAQEELDRRLDAIDEAHAAAAREAHKVVIWR